MGPVSESSRRETDSSSHPGELCNELSRAVWVFSVDRGSCCYQDPRHAAAYGGQHRIPSSALSRSTPFSPGQAMHCPYEGYLSA
eukprot:3939095-Rhodomonas_salina.1